MKESTFETPILLITFNRPSHTQKTLDAIKIQRPKYLYIFQDGARTGNSDDVEKCELVHNMITRPLNLGCDIKTNISEINLGCGQGPVTAITWFFENVEQGIIMEDDCLPHPDFFEYCEELLNRYKNTKDVMVVGATTYHDEYPCEDSYLFSKYFTGGAWASWQRAWSGFSFDLGDTDVKLFKKNIQKQFYSSAETNWWVRKVKQIKADTSQKQYWDYQMQIHILMNNGLAIRPQRNLISNIGFDSEGTHTLENDNRGEREVFPCLPLSHPTQISVNKKNDYLFMTKEHQKRIDDRIVNGIYNYMNDDNGRLNKLLLFYKHKKKAWKGR